MTEYYEIPLVAAPQRFTINLGSQTYQLDLKWADAGRDHQVLQFSGGAEEIATGWILEISDSVGERIVGGIPLVTGVDLLSPYAYLGFEGQLWVASTDRWTAPPTFGNLGDISKLYFVVPDA